MKNKYQKRKKNSEKKHVKDIKIFLKKKKTNGKKRPKKDIKIFLKKCQYPCERNKILSKEQKQKLVEYMRNYYLAHKKNNYWTTL